MPDWIPDNRDWIPDAKDSNLPAFDITLSAGEDPQKAAQKIVSTGWIPDKEQDWIPDRTLKDKVLDFLHGGDSGKGTEVDGVPAWGRENPNLYGVYGAAKETAKSMLPYLRYLDPADRESFVKKNTKGQTRELLMEVLQTEAMLATGPIGKAIGEVGGALFPGIAKSLTKSRSVLPSGLEDVMAKEAVPAILKPVAIPKASGDVFDQVAQAASETAPKVVAKAETPEIAPDSLILEVKGGATGELPKYAEGSAINLERLNTTEDVKQFINQRTKEAEEKIGKQKITWAQTRAEAEANGWDTKALRREWDKTGEISRAKIDATRQLNLNGITELQQMIKDLPYEKTTLTPEIRAKYLDVMDMIKVTSQMASEAGRSLNIHKRILSNDPAFKEASELQRVLKVLVGKGGERTDDLINGLKQIDLNDTAAVNQFIYNATNTKWQKLSKASFDLWINGLLSNPLTHIVNTTSNALTMAYQYPERLLGAAIESVRAKATGSAKGIFFGETAQDIFSVSKGLQDAVSRFAHTMRYGERVTKLDYPASAIPDKYAKYLPTRALMAEDAFFKGFIENQEMNRLAYRQAAKEGLEGKAFNDRIVNLLMHPTEQMLGDVVKRGQYLTYQKEVGEVGRLIFNARDKVPGLKYFIPFVKTPMNIAKFALERTPLNIPRLAARAISGDLKGAQLSEELAKPLMGTMLGTTVYQLAENGYITGGTPKNKAGREEKQNVGWQPYSIKIGDKYYSFARLEPLGSILGMAADMSQIKKEMTENDKFNLAAAIMGSITTNISNKTFMQGFTNMIQAISDPGRYGETAVKTLAGSAIPAVAGGVARSIDPQIRDIRGIKDTMQSRIPGLSESLPPKLTVWGEPAERPGSAVGRFLSPMQISQEKGSPIEKELTRLDLDIGYPSRKIKGVDIPQEQYWQMVKSAGEPAKKILDKMVTSGKWDTMPDKLKEKIISSVVEKFRDAETRKIEAQFLKQGKLKAVNW
jgi:hypothetical protein